MTSASTQSLAHGVFAAFTKVFGAVPARLVRAPSCVNLLGEHTDNASGLVLAAAVDQESCYAIAPNHLGRVRLFSVAKQQRYEQSLTDPPAPGPVQWATQLLGVVAILREQGRKIPGFDCAFDSNVPPGASLATAVECGLAYALNQLVGPGLNVLTLSRVAQAAGQASASQQGGLAQQLISVMARPGDLVRLDCRSLAHEYYPFNAGAARLVICDAGQHQHTRAGLGYHARQAQYELGMATLRQYYPGARTLRDVTLAQLAAHQAELGPVVYRHCRYVLEENQRVLAAGRLLEAGDLLSFGHLLNQSNARLRDYHQVGCPEQEALVALAQPLAGVFGARMMGSHPGGCTISLVVSSQVEAVGMAVRAGFAAQFGYAPLVRVARIVGGVSTLPLAASAW